MISLIVPFRPDGGQRDRVWAWCRAHWRACLPGLEIVEADSGHTSFHRGASINQGVQEALGDQIVIADADTVVSNVEGLFRALTGPRWLIGYSAERYFTLTAEQTDQILTRAAPGFLPPPPPRAFGITSWSGVLGITRKAFRSAGGFDERFADWGWEDRAFVHAADTILGPHARIDGYALHLWHPRGPDWASPGLQERQHLWQRYRDADGDVEAMRTILAEPR
jgi:N-terminal domain of galactosyltransferase